MDLVCPEPSASIYFYDIIDRMRVQWKCKRNLEVGIGMKNIRKKATFVLVFLSVFIICVVVTAGYVNNKSHMEYAQMNQLVLTKTNKINNVISKLLYKTQVLSALVIQNNGDIDDFERVAATIIDDPCIKNVILAPDGIVSNVYPMQNNEGVIGLDYFSKSEGNSEAIQARDTHSLVLGGPFNLIQGGQALVGRLPVYLPGAEGENKFWGIVSVTLNYPQVLDGAELSQLQDQGFAYEIWRISPDTDERQIISNSDYYYNKHARYVEQPVKIFNAEWYFRLSPIRNWYQYPETWIFTVVGMMVSLLIAFLVVYNHDLRQMKQELEKLTYCDPLTGILNRRGAFREIERLITGDSEKFTLCYLDLNKFKIINDCYGHNTGDSVLQQFVSVFERHINKNHVFARIGGDEFILLIKDSDQLDESLAFFDQIHHSFKQASDHADHGIEIQFSVGMAFYPKDGVNADELIGVADRKMYEAKSC